MDFYKRRWEDEEWGGKKSPLKVSFNPYKVTDLAHSDEDCLALFCSLNASTWKCALKTQLVIFKLAKVAVALSHFPTLCFFSVYVTWHEICLCQVYFYCDAVKTCAIDIVFIPSARLAYKVMERVCQCVHSNVLMHVVHFHTQGLKLTIKGQCVLSTPEERFNTTTNKCYFNHSCLNVIFT